MRCSCLKCVNNDYGYCGCYDSIEIDFNGECDSKWIREDEKDGDGNG